MNPNLKIDEWKIVEEGFDPSYNRASESLFSIGNGHMGQRANFEETYTGETHLGSYIAGIYYPDKTRVGWWKNGYPEYFAKVLNSPSWIGLRVKIEGEELDLAKCEIEAFRRELDMQRGTLTRTFTCRMESGLRISVEALRFVSMDDHEAGAIRYSLTLLEGEGEVEILSSVNADVVNEDSNYGEYFWKEKARRADNGASVIVTSTKKTHFHVAIAMSNTCLLNGEIKDRGEKIENGERYISRRCVASLKKGDNITIEKYVAVLSSQNHLKEEIEDSAITKVNSITARGFDLLLAHHVGAWARKWDDSDVQIEGDAAAQQGIRFNIFHLFQTYTGDDPRLNIGPKGFTGEKYGGSTYWDTEAFGLPFYLNTTPSDVARNLLIYRYNHLEKAIENAAKLGFNSGAALYPMVTMNGEECHNEWEITFEEIHRNGAIAFAIKRYIDHTGDEDYLGQYGLEVLIAISRFWSQRVNFSEEKQLYVMLGVTGPNEYENNVNNNWYTNKMAAWTLSYTLESLERLSKKSEKEYSQIVKKTALQSSEPDRWRDIIDRMYFPGDKKHKVFLQQDGYMDKEQLTADELDPAERPINQNWSWDRILRSCFIKQADVLQGIYNFEDEYDIETKKRNFDFYEPRTLHESSLSPSIYSIIASQVGYVDKAYELYLRTARLDIEDINREVKEGLHITSMAGTWLSIVEGFGGMRIRDNKLHLNPVIPDAWKSFSFKMRFRNSLIEVTTSNSTVEIANLSDNDIPLVVVNRDYLVKARKTEKYNTK